MFIIVYNCLWLWLNHGNVHYTRRFWMVFTYVSSWENSWNMMDFPAMFDETGG